MAAAGARPTCRQWSRDFHFPMTGPSWSCSPRGRSACTEPRNGAHLRICRRSRPARPTPRAGSCSWDLLPAVHERDLAAFGAALGEIQARVGACFASAQGGVFHSPAQRPSHSSCRDLDLPVSVRARGDRLFMDSPIEPAAIWLRDRGIAPTIQSRSRLGIHDRRRQPRFDIDHRGVSLFEPHGAWSESSNWLRSMRATLVDMSLIAYGTIKIPLCTIAPHE